MSSSPAPNGNSFSFGFVPYDIGFKLTVSDRQRLYDIRIVYRSRAQPKLLGCSDCQVLHCVQKNITEINFDNYDRGINKKENKEKHQQSNSTHHVTTV